MQLWKRKVKGRTEAQIERQECDVGRESKGWKIVVEKEKKMEERKERKEDSFGRRVECLDERKWGKRRK